MTIKEEYLNSILTICKAIGGGFFESSAPNAVLLDTQTGEKLLITDEELLFKAIDSKLIANWEAFELVLSFIIENRLMQLYQTNLDNEYQRKWKKLDQELLSYSEQTAKEEQKMSNLKPKNKKKQKKGRKQKKTKDTSPSTVYTTLEIAKM